MRKTQLDFTRKYEIIQVDNNQYHEIDKYIQIVTGTPAKRLDFTPKYDGVYSVNKGKPFYFGAPFEERNQVHQQQYLNFLKFIQGVPEELLKERTITSTFYYSSSSSEKITGKNISYYMRKCMRRFKIYKNYRQNWFRRDLIVFIWMLETYCITNTVRLKELKDEDFDIIAKYYPTKMAYELKYRWMFYRFSIVGQHFSRPKWSIEQENDLWRLIVKKSVPTLNIRTQLYHRGEGKYPFRTQPDIIFRFYMIKARKQSQKKGIFKKWVVWSPWMDMKLLEGFIKFGKRYKLIEDNLPKPKIYSNQIILLRLRILFHRMGVDFNAQSSEKLFQYAFKYLQNLRYINFDAESNSIVPSLPTSIHISDLNKQDIQAIRNFMSTNQKFIKKKLSSIPLQQIEQLDSQDYNLQPDFNFDLHDSYQVNIPEFMQIQDYQKQLNQKQKEKDNIIKKTQDKNDVDNQ